MDTFKSFVSKLYALNAHPFSDIALEVYRFQVVHNPVYRSFVEHLSIDPNQVNSLESIPFMPVSFFKTHAIMTGQWVPEVTFTSSGTTGMVTSRHLLQNLDFYLHHAQRCFEHAFGPLENYHFLALLPSYLERQGSSLIAMMDHFIKESKSPYAGFYLNETDKLLTDVNRLRQDKRKTIVWGVSFALLDLAERSAVDLSHCLIFETGGMKGRRKEITRAELHAALTKAFNVQAIYSEYGMTELLSQAYTDGTNLFHCSPWMRVIGRELTDPLHKGLLNETSGINVIDLANWHTVSFIETEDLGKVYQNGAFEILGRMDNSDVRGCNLLVE